MAIAPPEELSEEPPWLIPEFPEFELSPHAIKNICGIPVRAAKTMTVVGERRTRNDSANEWLDQSLRVMKCSGSRPRSACDNLPHPGRSTGALYAAWFEPGGHVNFRTLLERSVAAAIFLASGSAFAHVSITSGPGYADQTQEITFGVGHGCEGADTYSIQVEIPALVVAVRALNSDLGPAQVELAATGAVSSVTWKKPEASLLEADTNYYKAALRIKVPNQPFSTLYFPVHQVCRKPTGEELVTDWVSTDATGSAAEPAPGLNILPKRYAGWNKFKVPAPIDLATFFGDAAIVWKGDAAYSANPTTAVLIAETAGVTSLTALSANDEIWVKY